jgi:cytochrome P450
MLAMLIDIVDDETGEGMTDMQLRDEVMTFFLAGYETTSLTLSWVVHLLTQHPEALARLQAEVDGALAGRIPTFDDLAALTYTRAVIQEAMRLRPAAWQVPRVAIKDDLIDGFRVPAGTTVVPLIYGIHHNPSVWNNPERFDPGRVLAAAPATRHRLAWAPFGAGQRQCIGRDFSLMEAQIILPMLMQRFTFSAVSGLVAAEQLSGTLKPKGGVHVHLAKRDPGGNEISGGETSATERVTLS